MQKHPYLLLTIAPLLWAGNIVLARGLTTIVPPITLAFYRWVLATVIVLPFAIRPMRQTYSVVRPHLPLIVMLGFLGVSAFNTLLYTAVQTTTAINGSLMQTALPAFVIIISLFLTGERITGVQFVGVSICTLGTFVVVLHGDMMTLQTLNFVLGDLLILFGILLYALYSVLLRKAPVLPPIALIGYTFAIGAVLLLPPFLWERATGATFPFNQTTILSLLYIAIGPSIIAYFCWNGGISIIGANRGGLFINLLPLFAALLSILFLGEQLRGYHFAGFLLIVGGMLLFNRQPSSARSS